MRNPLIRWMFTAAAILLTLPAAATEPEFTLSIKNHRFDPVELAVPAGKKIQLRVKNLDATAEEFESHDLRREKVVPGNSEIVVPIGPLKPGRYEFFGDFHPDTAKGRLIAK